MIINNWSDIGVETSGRKSQFKTLCVCSKDRKKNKDEECLSVNIERGIGHCHNCRENFVIRGARKPAPTYRQKEYALPTNYVVGELSQQTLEFFANRGISRETLILNDIGNFIGKNTGENWITFPYYKDKLVNVGMRKSDSKTFKFKPECELCFYGMQNLVTDGFVTTNRVIITEGQIDSLSFYEVGLTNAISVPNGSPFQKGMDTEPKLHYLEDEYFLSIAEDIDEFIIATDDDESGNLLAQALGKHLGIEKCSRMKFDGLKDVNDLLVDKGKESLLYCYLKRTPMLEGIYEPTDKELLDFFTNGLSKGRECGIESLDEILTWESGVYVIHGAPSSKKSVLVDNITVGLANLHNYHTAIFSPETPTPFHIGRLVSIKTGKSMEDGKKMTYNEFMEGSKWVKEHYSFIKPPHNALDEILALWEMSIKQKETKVCVLDPFSKVSFDGDSLHNFVRTMFEKLTAFSIKHSVIVIVVAHPRKLELMDKKDPESDYKVSTPYDIAESSHFFNAPDFIMAVWTSKKYQRSPTKIYIQKSKYWHIAQEGESCSLGYDYNSWRLT